jgi:hypothetical protein
VSGGGRQRGNLVKLRHSKPALHGHSWLLAGPLFAWPQCGAAVEAITS